MQTLDHRGGDNSITEDGRTADRVADAIITKFDRIDHDAQAFRYPIDTKGKRISVPALCIDLVRLKELMGWLDSYLRGWSTFLYEARQAEQEFAQCAEAPSTDWLSTLTEATDRLMSAMSADDVAALRDTPEGSLIMYHYSLVRS